MQPPRYQVETVVSSHAIQNLYQIAAASKMCTTIVLTKLTLSLTLSGFDFWFYDLLIFQWCLCINLDFFLSDFRLNVLNLSNNRLQSVPYLGFQVSSMKMAPSLADEQHITNLASPGDKGMEENQDSNASFNGNETREDGGNSIEDFKFAFDALKDSITDLELKSKEDCESHDQQNDSDGKDNRERRSNKESLGKAIAVNYNVLLLKTQPLKLCIWQNEISIEVICANKMT